MSENVEYGGLCSTCNNAPDCTFPRHPHEPVFHCEEFDSGEPSAVKITDKDRSPPTHLYGDKERDSTKFMGLCSNCEDRETCVFPKPEGGVWHCEEYR
jgi:hypothetical protein